MRWREWNTAHLTSEGQLLPLVPDFPFLWRPPGLGVAAWDAPMLSGPRWPWDPSPPILVSPAGSWTRWHMWPYWKCSAGLSPGLPGQVPQPPEGRLSSIRDLWASQSWDAAVGFWLNLLLENSSPWTQEGAHLCKGDFRVGRDPESLVWPRCICSPTLLPRAVHEVKPRAPAAFGNTLWESVGSLALRAFSPEPLELPRSFQRPCFQRRGVGWTSGFLGSQVVLMCYVAGSPCLNMNIILSSKSVSCLWAQWEPESGPGSLLKLSWRGFSEMLTVYR